MPQKLRVINGKLHMRMDKRSGDLPVGEPSNMIQYAAFGSDETR
jgi:thymidylate synthase